MKNKGLIICLIILLAIIIIALAGVLVFSLNGNINFTNGKISFGKISTEIILDKKYDADSIIDVEIKSESGNITFEPSQDSNIRVVAYGQNENDIKISLEENKLNIDYTNYRTSWFGTYRNDIIVYIPQIYSNSINIKNDYGNCKVTDLENATIKVDCDCGNVELGKIKNATVKCDYGNIEIESILNKCDLRADCGNIRIYNADIKENSTIRADLGNVDIDKINDIYIDADVDLGKAKIYNNNRESNITLKINCDLGNITVGEK